MSETTAATPDAQPCGICSNGPCQVFHYGGPCPYQYTAGRFALPGACGVDTGEIHRAPLLREIAELGETNHQLSSALRFYANASLKAIFKDGGKIARAALPTSAPTDA